MEVEKRYFVYSISKRSELSELCEINKKQEKGWQFESGVIR